MITNYNTTTELMEFFDVTLMAFIEFWKSLSAKDKHYYRTIPLH